MYGPNDLPPTNRKRPKKKLSLEQEFLLIMRSRLGLLQEDLAWRFQVSDTTAPKVITTWVKLLSKEFGCLIICPSKGQICATPPVCFKNIYLKTKVIINCTEMFAQTPSSLEVQSLLWSEYKHHRLFSFCVLFHLQCQYFISKSTIKVEIAFLVFLAFNIISQKMFLKWIK